MATAKRLPVILDTDIGGDIDDTWALAFLLRCPELDLKLVTSATGDATYRAKLCAKLLEVGGRTDVPVGIGLGTKDAPQPQAPWVADYDLARYPGRVHQDGVQALIDTVLASPEPVTVIGIGPLPNLGAALAREPRLATRARFVGMQGSVYRGYSGSATVHAEYNVKADVPAAQAVFRAAWPKVITPLDTCGLVVLGGARYQRLRASRDPLARAVVANYELWERDHKQHVAAERSSVLFDTVAVYLAFAEELCRIEDLPIAVDGEGFTRVDRAAGAPTRCAVEWRNLDAFYDLLVQRLCGA